MCAKKDLFSIQLKYARLIVVVCFLISFLISFPAAGQDAEDVELELSVENRNVAPVIIDGVELFKVNSISSFTAEQRAAAICNRIKKAAGNPGISSDSVKIVTEDENIKIFAGNEFIMIITETDAILENINQLNLAGVVKIKIKSAIDSYRHNRSRDVLIKKSLYALVSLILLIVVFIALKWLGIRLRTGLENRIKERLDSVQNKSFNLIQSKQLWSTFRVVFKAIRIFVIISFTVIFLQYILGLFPWTSNVASYTLELFLNPLKSIIKGFIGFLPSLAFLIVIFFVTRYLLRFIKLLFNGIGQRGIVIKDFDAEWAMPTFRILRIFIIAFAVIVAYPYIPGSQTSAFKGVTVFIGILFSLGSSSFIGNLIAGYSMTYRKAFRKGDRIQVEDKIGIVEEQSLMVTRLRSLKNEEIVIPNSILLNSQIINYNARAKDLGLILHTIVGIGYETPWRQVDAMLKLAADRTEGLLKDPPPFVLKKSLGDFAVNYEINAYCNDAANLQFYYTHLHQNILDVFNENNVQIMTPAYEGDPEIPKVVPKDQWDTPLAKEQ
jgi:small-conductance mechanosensitive channel